MLARAHRNRLLGTGGSTGTRTRTWHLKRVLRCLYAMLPLPHFSNSIFTARRETFSLRPWAPAFLNLATATSGLRGADFLCFMVVTSSCVAHSRDSLESPMSGAAGRDRTCDACAFNAALYRLSYNGVSGAGYETRTRWPAWKAGAQPIYQPRSGTPCRIRTEPGRLERPVTSPEVQRCIPYG